MLDVERGEAVEKELATFIEKRARKEPNIDAQEELWKESVRAYNASREAERRAAWANYHVGQAGRLKRVMTNLVAFHEDKARELSSETKKGSA